MVNPSHQVGGWIVRADFQLAIILTREHRGGAEIGLRVEKTLNHLRHRAESGGGDLVVGERSAGERILDDRAAGGESGEVSIPPTRQWDRRIQKVLVRAAAGCLQIKKEEALVLAVVDLRD